MLKYPAIISVSSSPTIVSFADGTPAQLAAMIAAADAGQINLTDYWSVGDERTVHLDAMTAGDAFTTAMDAQDVVLVLMNESYMNDSNIYYVVGQKNILSQDGRMNTTRTTQGSWGDSAMRTDLNNKYYNALPEGFQNLLKSFVVYTGIAGSNSLQTVNDKIALFAMKEVRGSSQYAFTAETNYLSQIEYYETTANQIKRKNGSIYRWYTRSPEYNYPNYFDDILPSGVEEGQLAEKLSGISPFMCI